MKPNDQHNFVKSGGSELDGLERRGTSQVVERYTMPQGSRIYGMK